MRDVAAALARDGGIQRVLELARRHLDMDVAFLAEFTQGKQVYRALDGDASSFGWALDDGPELPDTYCRLMTSGQLEGAIPDAKAHPIVQSLSVTESADIGAYVGVPIHLPDGSLYGSFCCLSHGAAPVDNRDVKFLALLADLVAEEVHAQKEQNAVRDQVCELIDSESVEIALQPIVDITSGRLVGVEALSRFPAGYGPPDKVFAAASTAGVGVEMGRLAARKAYQLLPLLAEPTYLALNLDPELALTLVPAGTDVDQVPFHRIVVEITEHAAVSNYDALRDYLAPFRQRGMRLAIDDAGAGFASLHHVVELHPDLIKIDRSLIDGCAARPARRSVITAFVALANDLGAKVVAEGIEERDDLFTARDLGVGFAQGYLIERPTTDRDQIARWISDPLTLPTAGDEAVA